MSDLKEALTGQKEVTVKNNKGEEITIIVKELPFFDADKLAMAWGNILSELKLYTGLTEAEIKSLPNASQAKVWKEGRELNFFIYDTFVDEQNKSLKVAGMDQSEIVKQVATQILGNMMPQSQTSSSSSSPEDTKKKR